MTYQDFIKTKNKVKTCDGFDVDINEINPILFDFQKVLVKWALKKGQALLAEECGLGKTFQQLEWSRIIHEKTGGNILIIAPLGVAKQTASEEAPKLNVQCNLCRTQEDVKKGINITNYEMIEHFDAAAFVGVVLDESSILKNFTGSTRTLLKEKFKNTSYKLCCSATPAPNEFIELLNQADFLGIMDTSKALANYFINDFKTGKWRLKGHATDEFWQWVASWCMNIEKPSDLGFDDSKYILPPLTIKNEIIKVDQLANDFSNGLFREIGTSATSFHTEKRLTAPDRASRCAELIEPDKQYIIWCDTNYEADLLKQCIPDAVDVRGSDSPKFKEEATKDFKSGKIRNLISKPSIFGYGMNFQKCYNVIFCGLTYSYEDYYQALKRTYRFGQQNPVNVFVVLGDTELSILDVIKEKEEKQRILKNSQKQSVKDLQLLEIEGKEKKRIAEAQKIALPQWL